MKEDENEYELKNVKEELYNFIHWNKEIEKSLDELDQVSHFVTNITNENIKTGYTMLSIFRGLESEGYHPQELISGIQSHVSGATSSLESVSQDLKNIGDKIYGVTGTIANSEINMAIEVDKVRLFLEDHLQIPQISRVYMSHKDQLSSDDKIQKLVSNLDPLDYELSHKITSILQRFKNLNNKADLTSLGHLLSQFIDSFLTTLAPDDLIRNIAWVKRKTPYIRCIFVIIGHDLMYERNDTKYLEINKIAENYTNLLQRCDIIKHNPHNWDLTKLRLKVRNVFSEIANYTLNILNLRSLHFVENE